MKDKERVHRRCFPRKEARLTADLVIFTGKEKVYDTGFVIVEDVSLSGALLSKIKTVKASLPIKPFYMELHFKDKEYEGIHVVAQPVRFVVSDGALKLGVSFTEFSVSVG
jgi:hypothetical protein